MTKQPDARRIAKQIIGERKFATLNRPYRFSEEWLNRKAAIEARVERRVTRARMRREDRRAALASGKPVKYRVA